MMVTVMISLCTFDTLYFQLIIKPTYKIILTDPEEKQCAIAIMVILYCKITIHMYLYRTNLNKTIKNKMITKAKYLMHKTLLFMDVYTI